MNYSVKNNLLSLLVACGIFIFGAGIFIAFVNYKYNNKNCKNLTQMKY